MVNKDYQMLYFSVNNKWTTHNSNNISI